MRALLVIALAGCGRVGFDVVEGVDAGTDTFNGQVCGDLACAVNAGETCTTCADCVTLANVCGNGECNAAEATTCYADCGPAVWPWQAEAMALLTAVNQARTNGTTCPGGGGMQTAPALAYDASLEPTAREWAWETAHLGWTMNGSCNGRTGSERVNEVGASSGWKVYNAQSSAGAITNLLGTMGPCNEIMRTTNTVLGAAAAHDMIDAHAIMLR